MSPIVHNFLFIINNFLWIQDLKKGTFEMLGDTFSDSVTARGPQTRKSVVSQIIPLPLCHLRIACFEVRVRA